MIRRLEHLVSIGEEDRGAIARLASPPYSLRPQENLTQQGERDAGVSVILQGFAVRYRLLADGRRQILGFCLPGELCGLRLDPQRPLDHSIAAVSSLRVATLPLDEILALVQRSLPFARALLADALLRESIAREWVLNVGCRTAYERLAHLFCELYLRLQASGLACDGRYELPLRQGELADTLALSAVHVNRTLMEMRRRGLVSLQGRMLIIHDMAGLQQAAGFDPDYLQLATLSPPPPPGRAAAER